MERMLCGDALEHLRTLQPESVHVCVTSPPYYHLRDYDTSGQIGREAAPEAYIERLTGVFREVRRVLRRDGTLWLNIGDSYAARSGARPPGNTRNPCARKAGQSLIRSPEVERPGPSPSGWGAISSAWTAIRHTANWRQSE